MTDSPSPPSAIRTKTKWDIKREKIQAARDAASAQAQQRYQENAEKFAEHERVKSHVDSGTTVLSPVQIDKLPDDFLEVHGKAIALGADCGRCPLRLSGRGPVLHEIRPNAKLAVIMEAPGEGEVAAERPAVGRSGGMLNVALNVGDVVREEVTVANCIMCQPPGEDGSYTEMMEDFNLAHKRACRQADILKLPHPPPPLTPDAACRGALITALAQTNADVWLTLGKQALAAIAHVAKVAYDKEKHRTDDAYIAPLVRQHGAPVWMPPVADALRPKVLLSAYHPAMAMRDKKEWMPVILDVITRAARASRDLHTLDWEEYCETYWLEPSVDDIIAFLQLAIERRAELTVDIETNSADRVNAQVRTIQLAMTIDGHEYAINIPIRHMDGTDWWLDSTAIERFMPWLVRALDELPLAGQFLQYDTPIMLRDHWMTDRKKSWTDLTILYRATKNNDLPKNLGAIVARLFPAPRHKDDIDHKSTDNVDDNVLHKYGIKDVIYEMRCLEPLREQVTQCGAWPTVKLDSALLPIWRDMGIQTGLVVNERIRGEFSAEFNRAVCWLTLRFQDLVDKKINPRSVTQLQDLFFGQWGYKPVLLPDGTEIDESTLTIWDDEELGSTSSAAIIQLQKRRVMKDPRHTEAFECLLELRAYDKLRGTYIDNLQTYSLDTEAWTAEYGWIDEVREWRIAEAKDGEYKNQEEHVALPRRPYLSRLLPTYMSHTIPTGRAASQGPNVQNAPAMGKANIRRMWVAPPGHVIVGADFDQLEARLYAALSGDKLILKAIKDKLDIHSLNAATLLAKDKSEFWAWYHKVADESPANAKFRKYWRTVAKRFAFLCIYGGEVDILYEVMANARDRATGKLSFPKIQMESSGDQIGIIEMYERWHRDHPETREWHEYAHAMMSETGHSQVPGLDGRKRWFPGGPSKVNAVPNMLVQGLAASIANRAMLAIAEEIPFGCWSRWTGLSLQVHDYLQVYVPVSRYEQAMAIINKCMPWEFQGVPITASAQVSWDVAQQG